MQEKEEDFNELWNGPQEYNENEQLEEILEEEDFFAEKVEDDEDEKKSIYEISNIIFLFAKFNSLELLNNTVDVCYDEIEFVIVDRKKYFRDTLEILEILESKRMEVNAVQKIKLGIQWGIKNFGKNAYVVRVDKDSRFFKLKKRNYYLPKKNIKDNFLKEGIGLIGLLLCMIIIFGNLLFGSDKKEQKDEAKLEEIYLDYLGGKK